MVSEALAAVADLAKQERLGAVATVVAGPDVGAKAVIDFDAGYIAGAVPDGVASDVLADAKALMEHEQNRRRFTVGTVGEHVDFEAVGTQP